MLIFLMFLYGLAIGSFLNVVIDRLPRSESLFKAPSHCDACGRRLRWSDMAPVLSYLWLKGRCRYCGTGLPRRVLWVELGSGVFLVSAYLSFGLSYLFAYVAFWGFVFLVLGVIDFETRLVPDIIVYPGLLVALATAPFWPSSDWKGSLIGGVVGLLALLIPALLYRQGMGWGDVKVSALMGVVAAFPGILLAMASAFVTGGLVAVFLLALGRRGRKDSLPFVPFLSAGLILTLFWGEPIGRWYWQLWPK